MAVSVFPVAGGGGSKLDPDASYHFQYTAGSTRLYGDGSGWPAGTYILNAIPVANSPVSPTGSFASISNLVIVTNASVSDSETKGGSWSTTGTLVESNSFNYLGVNLLYDAFVRIDYYSPGNYLPQASLNLVATIYSSTGNVTLTGTTNYITIIGGGGGGNSPNGLGGGGGGSGYITSFTRGPGTYALSVGAGGTGSFSTGGAGGTTTFDGQTASGGLGAFPGNSGYGSGGAGGSSGGGGTYNWTTGFGGINGETGGGGAGGASGAGSGVLQPIYCPAGVRYTVRGQAGAFYGGGNGSGTINGDSGAVKNGLAGTGGGGGANDGNQPGGNGGSGAAYILGVS